MPVAHGWQRSRSLVEWLRDEPYRFEFYQLVRLLERLHATPSTSEFEVARRDSVRFRSQLSLGFPASEVQRLDLDAARPANLTVNVFGLAGALGPLPHPYTEMLLEANARRDRAGVDFLDIFNHRLISLLYRVRQAHEPALTARAPHESVFAESVFAIIGLAIRASREELGFPAQSMLHYSGLLSRRPRSAAGLETLLRDYFRVPVHITQFSGIWRKIDSSQWTTLGRTGKNQELGFGAALGKRAWDQGGAITVAIGPLNFLKFGTFLPGGKNHAALCNVVKFYLGMQKARLRLKLNSAQVPQLRLGRSRLGHSSWLGLPGRPYSRTEASVTLRIH